MPIKKRERGMLDGRGRCAEWRREGRGMYTFVTGVVEVDEIFFPFAGEGGCVDGVTVVLAGDVAATGCQVESWDVVSTVAVLEFDGSGTGGQGEQLVSKTDAHNGDLGRFHQFAEMVDCILAMGWVTGTVGDEDSVEVVGDFVDGVIVREGGDAGTAADKASQDVFLDSTVDDSHMEVSGGTDVERRFGADLPDKVDLFRVHERFVLIGVVFLANGNTGERRSLLPKICYDCPCVHPRNRRNAFPCAPLAQTLHRSPMAVLLRNICDHHTNCLNIG